MNGGGAPPADVLDRALLALAAGRPEMVLVDKRVLDVLLGPLADLIVQLPVSGGRLDAPGFNPTRDYDPDEDGFVWDDDPC